MGHLPLKRPIPTHESLQMRFAILTKRHLLPPACVDLQEPFGLAEGNNKLGRSGTKFRSVFVWNLPAIRTCPGASQACLVYCYNGDERIDVFPTHSWNENLAWFQTRPEVLQAKISDQLLNAPLPCAVRIHSSGDFFSVEYIEFWEQIIQKFPGIRFWAYTRSWTVPTLQVALKRLRQLDNLELFASWDSSMENPPPDWRISLVTEIFPVDIKSFLPFRMFACPEQLSEVANCASCGFCMSKDKRGILFTLH